MHCDTVRHLLCKFCTAFGKKNFCMTQCYMSRWDAFCLSSSLSLSVRHLPHPVHRWSHSNRVRAPRSWPVRTGTKGSFALQSAHACNACPQHLKKIMNIDCNFRSLDTSIDHPDQCPEIEIDCDTSDMCHNNFEDLQSEISPNTSRNFVRHTVSAILLQA